MTLHTLCPRCGHEITLTSWSLGSDRAFEVSCTNCGIAKVGCVKRETPLKATFKEVSSENT